jgi:flagellar basal body-associated protein FliL
LEKELGRDVSFLKKANDDLYQASEKTASSNKSMCWLLVLLFVIVLAVCVTIYVMFFQSKEPEKKPDPKPEPTPQSIVFEAIPLAGRALLENMRLFKKN